MYGLNIRALHSPCRIDMNSKLPTIALVFHAGGDERFCDVQRFTGQQLSQQFGNIPGIIQTRVVATIQAQPQALQHSFHSRSSPSCGGFVQVLDVNPRQEALRNFDLGRPALPYHHRIQVPVAASHKHTRLKAMTLQLFLQPCRALCQCLLPNWSSSHLVLSDPSELCAKCCQLWVVYRLNISPKLRHWLARRIHQDDRELDDLLRRDLLAIFTSGFKVQHCKRVKAAVFLFCRCTCTCLMRHDFATLLLLH
mmetsp:Transcript_6097/g.14585  ORF Transcript_6097/g.14585 Transcript_6097/m.14585 type:complete len:252 (+) Transcript_6097:65-820(+)